jgi:hypothetical protein
VDNEDTSSWLKESPDRFLPEHFFFMAIPKVFWRHWKNKNKISPNIFYSDKCKNGLSTDWSKYSTPHDTKTKRTRQDDNTGVIEFSLFDFFRINNEKKYNMTLEHDPIREKTDKYPFVNRGHSLIHGITKNFKTEIERELTDISNWVENLKPIDLR